MSAAGIAWRFDHGSALARSLPLFIGARPIWSALREAGLTWVTIRREVKRRTFWQWLRRVPALVMWHSATAAT